MDEFFKKGMDIRKLIFLLLSFLFLSGCASKMEEDYQLVGDGSISDLSPLAGKDPPWPAGVLALYPRKGDCLCVQYVLMIGDRSLLHAYIAIAKVPATINNLFQNSLQENRAVVNLPLLQ